MKNKQTAIFNIIGSPKICSLDFIVDLGNNIHTATKTSEMQYKTPKGTDIEAYLPYGVNKFSGDNKIQPF